MKQLNIFQASPTAIAKSAATFDGETDSLNNVEEGEDDLSYGNEFCNDIDVSKSTKLPIKPRPKSMKKKLQEEEFEVMKGLASTLSQTSNTANGNKNAKITQDGECETFGSYMTESLRKLDSVTRHLVQYHVNNILFQAQMGMLGESQHRMSSPQQQQQSFFPQQQFPSQLQQQFISPQQHQVTTPHEWINLE